MNGNIHVRGEVEVDRSPSLTEEHKTERNEDNTHERKKYFVEKLTLFVVIVYAGLTWWQGCAAKKSADAAESAAKTASGQLEIMRLQQRSWIQITPETPIDKMKLDKVKKLEFVMQFENFGSIPATKIFIESLVEIVKSDRAPAFNYSVLHDSLTSAPLYPKAKNSFAAILAKNKENEASELSPVQRQELAQGDAYIAIYGRATYEDRVGNWWVNFCLWKAFPIGKTFQASDCVNYNTEGGTLKNK